MRVLLSKLSGAAALAFFKWSLENGAKQAEALRLERDADGRLRLAAHPAVASSARLAAMLAERGGQALGMLIYYPDYSTHRGEAGVYVQDIYVSDAARGLGVGRGLLAAMLRQQDWGAQFITLGVSADNAVAMGFYGRIGFRQRVEQAGLGSRIEIDSAGTGDWHVGKAPDSRACAAAGKRGYRLTALRARQVHQVVHRLHQIVIGQLRHIG